MTAAFSGAVALAERAPQALLCLDAFHRHPDLNPPAMIRGRPPYPALTVCPGLSIGSSLAAIVDDHRYGSVDGHRLHRPSAWVATPRGKLTDE
jgi:hypothetical protein